ncbi:MAG: hypothetical protein ACK4PI_10060 [Tepidisphaerales bacterium]
MRNLPRRTAWLVLLGLLGAGVGCDRTINEVRSPAPHGAVAASPR